MRRLAAVLIAMGLVLAPASLAYAHDCGHPTGRTETDEHGTVWEEWISPDGETYWSEKVPPWTPPPPGPESPFTTY